LDTANLDQLVQTLQQNKDRWARLPVTRKVMYLDGILRRFAALGGRQAEACNRAKGVAEGTPRSGEEWAHVYQTVRLLRLLKSTLSGIASHGRNGFPLTSLRIRADSQLIARVFPLSFTDRLLYAGIQGEVWMQPGVSDQNLGQNIAAFYRRSQPEGKVALVLGAGNVASIGPSDLLQKLFVEGQVCLFKHNPVTAYLAPVLEEAFGELMRDGFLCMTQGGAEEGDYLCGHPGIDEIHLTGSDRTYEAIVFGPGEEGRRRKRERQPRMTKRFTCELGNVTPIIVVPGPWTSADVQFQAENIVTQMTVNCGFNCLSARVLVLARGWPQGRELMDAIRALLRAEGPRKAYYPGVERRYDEVVGANRTAEAIGTRSEGVLPYTLVPDLDPDDRDNPCFRTECFMPLLAQTSLQADTAPDFLRGAVEFANMALWGTLSASVIIHPETRRRMGPEFENCIAEMRYGTVGINVWTALGYVLGSTTWGAYPGHEPDDIQSGSGAVHNAFLFDRPQKSVVTGPFRSWPRPPWFVTNRATHHIFPLLCELERRPGALKTLRVMLAALRG
jgi:acyl-CoA reductase-like NAD-dependent aldehyde dehydrogenase